MTFEIPMTRLLKLLAYAKKVEKKGASVRIERKGTVVNDAIVYLQDKYTHTVSQKSVKVECAVVEVEGAYKINGWEFVGTIEHTENGNIIRLANSKFEGKVPERYKTNAPICEHCHSVRARKDTYLIYNESNDEFKQVGKSCLNDYTQGLDAQTCASILSVLEFASSNSRDYELDSDELFNRDSSYSGFDCDYVREHAVALVLKKGFKSGVTKELFTSFIIGNQSSDTWRKEFGQIVVDDNTKSIANEITEFAKSIKDSDGYMYNAKLAWLKSYSEYRDFALICSFVNTYLKIKAKDAIEQSKRDASEYVGNIGDKLTIDVKSIRVICSYETQYSYYNYAVTVKYEIIDTEGRTFIWSTSSGAFLGPEDAKKIVGFVKGFNEYKGIKQTVLTRCKVIA